MLATAPPPDIHNTDGLDVDTGFDDIWNKDGWVPADDRPQVLDEDPEGVLD